MIQNTLFGKPLRSASSQEPYDKETFASSLEYRLHQEIDPAIVDELTDVEKAMVGYVSNQRVVYPDGRMLSHAVSYEIGAYLHGVKNEPLAQITLEYALADPSMQMQEEIEIPKNLRYNTLLERTVPTVFAIPREQKAQWRVYDTLRERVNGMLVLSLGNLHRKKVLVTEESGNLRLHYIHPRFVLQRFPRDALSHLRVALGIVHEQQYDDQGKNARFFSLMEMYQDKEKEQVYAELSCYEQFILETLQQLRLLESPFFAEMKEKVLSEIVDKMEDPCYNIENGKYAGWSVKELNRILASLETFSPRMHVNEVGALKANKKFMKKLRGLRSKQARELYQKIEEDYERS